MEWIIWNIVGIVGNTDSILSKTFWFLKFSISDEDLAGDHLLAEAKFPLDRILPQMNKKFQVSLEKPSVKVRIKLQIGSAIIGAL